MVKPIGPLLGVILAGILTLCAWFSGAGGSGFPVRMVADLDGDGIWEEYLLEGGSLTVREGGEFRWRSSPRWRVDSFFLGDADNDGTDNLVLSLWKRGSFGPYKPFWHKGKDISYKNHLFVFKLVDDTFKEVWCSSNLDRPIVSFTIEDTDGDGLNELVVEEGHYRKVFGERYALDREAPVRTTVWQWQEWGYCLTRPKPDKGIFLGAEI
jgi:hypothetical protein